MPFGVNVVFKRTDRISISVHPLPDSPVFLFVHDVRNDEKSNNYHNPWVYS